MFLVRLVVVALVYYGGARLGLLLAFPGTNASAVWPPSGIALAAIAVWGRGMWPAVALGALVANGFSFLDSGASLVGALLLAGATSLGNTGEAMLGARAVQRWCHGDPFWDVPGACRFAASAAFCSAFAASLGTLSLMASGSLPAQNAPFVWWTWWMGDTAGIVITAPLLLAWSQSDPLRFPSRQWPEAGILALLSLASSAWIFGVGPFDGGTISPLSYLTIPFLLWAAFRFGRRGATVALVSVSGLAVWGTTHGHGPFHRPSLSESLLLLQTFMGVLAMTVLVVSASLAERGRGEAALRQAHDELEARVQQRTAQLGAAHEQVQANYARLQELQGLRDSLTHMIFHDLRTPLNALNYLLQLLESEELSPAQSKTVELSLQSGQTLSHIIGDLLDVHLMESGHLRLKREPLAVAPLLNMAVRQAQLLADYKGVALKCEIAPDLPPVFADAQKLGRVWGNLLDNALRFTPEGGVITVSATLSKASNGAELLFAVRDTGIGIAPADFELIFQKFGHVVPSGESHGAAPGEPSPRASTGLGLTFCRIIVEAHGGTLSVESEVGRGSCFFFSLPIGPSALLQS